MFSREEPGAQDICGGGGADGGVRSLKNLSAGDFPRTSQGGSQGRNPYRPAVGRRKKQTMESVSAPAVLLGVEGWRKERRWRDCGRGLFWRKEAVSTAGGAQEAHGDSREL